MNELLFVTGNSLKFELASHAFAKAGIVLGQQDIAVDEVQSEDGEYVARKKCQEGYDRLRKPLLVSDDSWTFPGLNGFPGPYIKSVNHWFSVADWVRLVEPLTDRRVILKQYIVYQDEKGQRMFTNEVLGSIVTPARGVSDVSAQSVITLAGDDGLTIAEALAKSPKHYNDRAAAKLWHNVAAWYRNAA